MTNIFLYRVYGKEYISINSTEGYILKDLEISSSTSEEDALRIFYEHEDEYYYYDDIIILKEYVR